MTADDDLLLVSRKAMSVRFTATDEALRPMGRATSGVIGMRFQGDDELLAMEVARPERDRVHGHRRRVRQAHRRSRSTACRAAAATASRR